MQSIIDNSLGFNSPNSKYVTSDTNVLSACRGVKGYSSFNIQAIYSFAALVHSLGVKR
ncbi:hypothetical protein LDVICp199 [lymphocystis disease virus-China]|uniref:Uncharacterized protein n=1 Tax=lymphocystis disease virus-China TaxID=256729 RepID=Q677R5_9VIRU|nr:hypothetical protein LDVICp199 [lymphocystis disease virus-China]AAU11042.1 hypothetical protein [lymphocystis disease virus-China]